MNRLAERVNGARAARVAPRVTAFGPEARAVAAHTDRAIHHQAQVAVHRDEGIEIAVVFGNQVLGALEVAQPLLSGGGGQPQLARRVGFLRDPFGVGGQHAQARGVVAHAGADQSVRLLAHAQVGAGLEDRVQVRGQAQPGAARRPTGRAGHARDHVARRVEFRVQPETRPVPCDQRGTLTLRKRRGGCLRDLEQAFDQ